VKEDIAVFQLLEEEKNNSLKKKLISMFIE